MMTVKHRMSRMGRSHWRLAPWAKDLYGSIGLLVVALVVVYAMLGAFGRN